MARCRYSGQCVKKTEGMGAERWREQRLHTADGDHGGDFDMENEEMCGEGARSVERDLQTKKAVRRF